MKRRRFTLLIFFIILFSSYVTMGYVRHYFYEVKMKEDMQFHTEGKEESRKQLYDFVYAQDRPFGGTPEGAAVVNDPAFKDEIYSLEVIREDYSEEYQTEVTLLLLEEFSSQKWNLWHAYKWLVISSQIRRTFYCGSNLVIVFTSFPDEWGYSLAESIALWEASGGKREGDWMNMYKHSPEYESWLETIFQEIAEPKERTPPPEPLSPENKEKFQELIDRKISEALDQGKSMDDPEVQSLLLAKKIMQLGDSNSEEREKELKIFQAYEPMSIEERYLAVKQPIELPLGDRIFCSDFMRAVQRMVEISYQRYLMHVGERDVVRAGIDAWIVEIAGDSYVRTGKLDFSTIGFLKKFEFPFTDTVIDICVIIGISVLLTFLVMKESLRE